MTLVCKNDDCPAYCDRTRPLKVVAEMETVWACVCEVCGCAATKDKQKVGGTIGSGQRADGTRTVVGRGF